MWKKAGHEGRLRGGSYRHGQAHAGEAGNNGGGWKDAGPSGISNCFRPAGGPFFKRNSGEAFFHVRYAHVPLALSKPLGPAPAFFGPILKTHFSYLFMYPRSTPHASCPQDKVKTRKADMMDRGFLRAFIPPAHYVTQAADSEPIV